MTTLSIITVTYNSKKEIEDFVRSLDDQAMDWRLWLIDNASTDGTPAVLSTLAEADSRITVVLNTSNVGLAAANNQPLSQLRSRYVAIVNPDVKLHSGALHALVEYLDQHRDVVAAGPVNVDEDGTPHSSFHHAWGLRHLLVWRLLPGRVTRWLYERVRRYDEQDVLFASGACLLVRTEDFVAIGGYDPEYFLTVEDVCDLCIRLRGGDPKKRVVVLPGARITHLKARSSVAAPFVTLWHGAHGSIYHFRKHHGRVAGALAFSIILLSVCARTVSAALRAPFEAQYRRSFDNHRRLLEHLFRRRPLLRNRSDETRG
jgi:GT2 family glycosyltransferase